MSLRDQDFLDFVLDQLSGLGRLSSRRMFGAIGLYQGEHFFGIIDEGRLYFITDESTRPRYENAGAKPFQYAPGKFLRTYYDVPVDVVEDDAELSGWAREAVSVQKRRSAGKTTKGRATRKRGSRGPASKRRR